MLFRNRLEIINPGSLPKGWTVEKLLRTHDSKSRNLILARALNWAGYVEKSGNGTEAIVRRCLEAGLPEPEYHPDNVDFKMIIWRRPEKMRNVQNVAPQVAPVVAPDMVPVPANTQGRVLVALRNGALSRQELATAIGVVRKARSLTLAINELIADDLVELTISDPKKRNSKLQKYRLTKKGAEVVGL